MEIEDIKLEQALLAELVAGHQFSVTYLSLPMEVECRISTPAPTRCAKRALEVLLLADRCIATQEVNSLSAMLPAWFLRQFTVAPDAAALQLWYDVWRSADEITKKKMDAERGWDFDGWVHWLLPEQRQWLINSVEIEGEEEVVVRIAVVDVPAALGALEVLFSFAAKPDDLRSFEVS